MKKNILYSIGIKYAIFRLIPFLVKNQPQQQ